MTYVPPSRPPVNEIRASQVRINQITSLVEDVRRGIAPALEAIVASSPDGYPGGGGGPGSGVANPTLGAVIARARYAELYDRIAVQIVEVHGHLVDVVDAIAHAPTAVDTAVTARQTRCVGGDALEGGDVWGDPACERNAVTRDGLCDPCRQRRDRWRREPDAYVRRVPPNPVMRTRGL